MKAPKLFYGLGFSDDETWALAEFVKCVGWTQIRQTSVDDAQAELIREGLLKLAKVLPQDGYAPR